MLDKDRSQGFESGTARREHHKGRRRAVVRLELAGERKRHVASSVLRTRKTNLFLDSNMAQESLAKVLICLNFRVAVSGRGTSRQSIQPHVAPKHRTDRRERWCRRSGALPALVKFFARPAHSTGVPRPSLPRQVHEIVHGRGLFGVCTRARFEELPRHLVDRYVNRRTVADQATSTVELLRRRLLTPGNNEWQRHEPTFAAIASALQQLSVPSNVALAVSTLRGELADNQEWKGDPAQPAIIVSTIDMIGSKLLFSGYGDGPYWRPQHAGLIGASARASLSRRRSAISARCCARPRRAAHNRARAIETLRRSNRIDDVALGPSSKRVFVRRSGLRRSRP